MRIKPRFFYDAVDSFNGLGIFPDNISINEVKQLVTGENRVLDKIRFKSDIGDGFENRLCLVSSYSTITFSFGPIILSALLSFIPLVAYVIFFDYLDENFNITRFKLLTFLLTIPWCILFAPLLFSFLSFTSMEPCSIGSLITFGYYEPNLWPGYHYQEYFPSYGWISTIGLNGIKSFNGDFYGRLIKIPAIFWTFYSGIVGFTGISIRKIHPYSCYRLGFALHVKVDISPPGM
jgi:hypothetical protein